MEQNSSSVLATALVEVRRRPKGSAGVSWRSLGVKMELTFVVIVVGVL